MKKITLFLSFLIVTSLSQAQIVYTTVLTDGFETSNGFPANFLVKKQQAWATLNATNNPYPYTGSTWKDLYSNGYTASKTYQVSADQTAPHGGTQCLKFTIPNSAFVDVAPHDTVYSIRLRSLDNKISFNTTSGEGITKYEVTFWAKTDGADKTVIINDKTTTSTTYLTLTSTWQKFTIARYCTGTSVTALGFDFAPATDGSDYVVYLDDMIIKQRVIPYSLTASEINTAGFTANWSMVVGANSYNLIVEKSDGATPANWTAITGSPFVINDVNTTNYVLTNLSAGNYRYRLTATDGTTTTVESNNVFALVSATDVKQLLVRSITQNGNSINLELACALKVSVFNSAGQEIQNINGQPGSNSLVLKNKGLNIIKAGSEVYKMIL